MTVTFICITLSLLCWRPSIRTCGKWNFSFVLIKCNDFHEILLLRFIVTQVIFVCILWQSCQRSALWNKMNTLFVHSMDAERAQYNMQNYDKHETLLLDMCFLYLYFPADWVGKYLGTYQNNLTHISSAAAYYVFKYKEKLFPWKCLQRYCKNKNHVVVLHYYRFQKYDLIFHQTFCFLNCDFYPWII